MKSISKLKDEARRCEQQEQWDKAITAYLQVLKISEAGEAEMELPLYNRVGDLYIRLGRPDDAVKYYEQAAERYADIGLFNNAMALCNKALRFRPERLEIIRKLAQYSQQQGFLTDAMQYYVSYAEKQFGLGQHDAGLSALEEFATASGDPEARLMLARRLQALGRTERAVTELRTVYGMHAAAGRSADAAAVLEEVRSLDPGAAAVLETEPPSAAPAPAADAPPEATSAEAAAPPAAAEPEPSEPEVRTAEPEERSWDGGPVEGLETAYFDAAEYDVDVPPVETTEVPIEAPDVAPLEGLETTMFDADDAEDVSVVGDEVDVEHEERSFDGGGYIDSASAAHASEVPSRGLHGSEDLDDDADIGEPLPLLTDSFDAFIRTQPEVEAVTTNDFDTTIETEAEEEPVTDFAGDVSLASDGVAAEDAPAGVESIDVAAEQEAAQAAQQEMSGGSEYVDLAELLSLGTEQTTRFRIEELDPSGDEERDFADVLEQFKAKLLSHLPPDDVEAHYDLGLAFREMGLLDEAIMVFQIAARAGHMRLKIFEELGQCFLEKQQYNIAEKVLRRALSLEHADELELLGVYYHLGRACEALGQVEQARDAYERVLGMDINFQDASERLTRL